MADLRALLKEGKYSDLTIICQKKEFKVHRNIICAQSPVLAAAIDGENQESNANRVINVTNHEPRTVKMMLEYLYTGDYELSEEEDCETPEDSDLKDDVAEIDDPANQRALARLSNEAEQEKGQEAEAPKQKTEEPLPYPENELIPNIKINAIANYYKIVKLADAATEKAEEILNDEQVNMSPSMLAEVTRHAFSLSGDTRLHEVVSSAVADKIDVMVACEELRNIGGVGNAGLAIIEKLAARIADLEAVNISHQQKQEAFNATLKAKEDRWKQVAKIKSCRSCGTAFNSFLEKASAGPDVDSPAIRCKGCKAKSWAPAY